MRRVRRLAGTVVAHATGEPSIPTPMLRLLASGLLTRTATRRLARVIPNPLVRTLAIAATGYAVNRLMTARSTRTTGTLPRRPALLRGA